MMILVNLSCDHMSHLSHTIGNHMTSKFILTQIESLGQKQV